MPEKRDSKSNLPRTGRLSRGAIAGMAVARAGIAHLGHKAQSLTRDEAQQALADQLMDNIENFVAGRAHRNFKRSGL